MDNLEGFLESRQLLLVVDNREHVNDEAAEVVQRLLKAAADLSVLATSRQRLGIPGQAAWTIPAMMALSANTASSRCPFFMSSSPNLGVMLKPAEASTTLEPSFV